MLWPFGRPWAVGYLGGRLAESMPDAGTAEAAARAELARYFGAETVARSFPEAATVAHWAADPLFRGGYSYARVGAAGARAVLAGAALAEGRLRFAGEACHSRYAGTVGGAWDSGVRAAEATHAALG
ncbi:FAD-dependent oxidoreductase [Siccirubricoccus deserti]